MEKGFIRTCPRCKYYDTKEYDSFIQHPWQEVAPKGARIQCYLCLTKRKCVQRIRVCLDMNTRLPTEFSAFEPYYWKKENDNTRKFRKFKILNENQVEYIE